MFGTARMTVHNALRDLAAQGLLLRRPGAGTFVAARKAQSTFLEIRNIRDEITERGHSHTARVHLLAAEPCDLVVATELNAPPGTDVFHSIIVHKENGRPIQLEDRYVNPAFAQAYLEQDFTVRTPNEYLMRLGPLEAAEHIIQSTTPVERTRELLEMPPGEPVLLLRRRTWSRGVIVTSVRLLHPGTRFSLIGYMTLQDHRAFKKEASKVVG
jgi:GntR family histidine utilization transcriptional repressor